jgi:hypothetical protein
MTCPTAGSILASVSASRSAFAACLLAALCGCSSIGPGSVTRDRFDYLSSISESRKRQMLLNMLKVRYADTPVFLEVSSVVSSYSLESEISLFGQGASSTGGGSFRSITGTGRYSDSPTISYAPLSGDRFTKSIMTPISLTALFGLVQGGYPVDAIFRLCVKQFGGLENSYGGYGTRAGDPRFAELLSLMREEQAAGGNDLQLRQVEERYEIVVAMRPAVNEAMAARQRRMAELIGLDPAAREFRVVPGIAARGKGEIPVQTRSMLQVLIDLGSYVEVPPKDVAEGRVFEPPRNAEQVKLFPAPLRVHHAVAQPPDAYVAIPYRDGWFYIEDRDHVSKAVFTFAILMFSLTETDVAATPVLTIPVR